MPYIQLKRWDYRSSGWYFIRICVNDRRKQTFEYMHNGFMCLSDVGTMAHRYWFDIPHHFEYVLLNAFVVMPDHVHEILTIHHTIDKYYDINAFRSSREVAYNISTTNIDPINTFSNVSPKYGSLPTIIRSYKSAVSNICHKNNNKFQRQPRYYEKIIRSNRELMNIHRYILNDSTRWCTHHSHLDELVYSAYTGF